MRKIVLTVVTVVLLYAIAVGAAPVVAHPSAVGPAARQDTPAARDRRPEIRIFLGTISKTGNQFVFSDDASKSSYQLDDQETASKFDGKKVKVTGTLDASNNIIRVQSIETTA
jgi:Protein of unknown function (DUF5818)